MAPHGTCWGGASSGGMAHLAPTFKSAYDIGLRWAGTAAAAASAAGAISRAECIR